VGIIRFFVSFITNLVLGFIIPAVIITQLSGKQAVVTGQQVGLSFKLDTFGILALIIFIILYNFVSKKYLGQSLGSKIANLLTRHKQ